MLYDLKNANEDNVDQPDGAGQTIMHRCILFIPSLTETCDKSGNNARPHYQKIFSTLSKFIFAKPERLMRKDTITYPGTEKYPAELTGYSPYDYIKIYNFPDLLIIARCGEILYEHSINDTKHEQAVVKKARQKLLSYVKPEETITLD
jgi:hypothetical protein